MEYIKNIFFILSFLIILIIIILNKANKKDHFIFLISSLILTLLLVLVISAKIHHLLRDQFNISNTITYTFISIPFAVYFIKFRKVILRNNPFLLVISILFIGLAVILDLLTDGKILVFYHSDFVEEILRILGAMFWMIYFIFYSINIRKT